MALVAVVYLFQQEKIKRIEAIVFGALYLPLTYFFGKIASLIYYNPRPFVAENITPLLAHAADNGFPSDHSLLAGVLAMMIFTWNRKAGIVFWILAVLVGGARILAGVHHGVDILTSFVLAVFAFYICDFLLSPMLKKVALKINHLIIK